MRIWGCLHPSPNSFSIFKDFAGETGRNTRFFLPFLTLGDEGGPRGKPWVTQGVHDLPTTETGHCRITRGWETHPPAHRVMERITAASLWGTAESTRPQCPVFKEGKDIVTPSTRDSRSSDNVLPEREPNSHSVTHGSRMGICEVLQAEGKGDRREPGSAG